MIEHYGSLVCTQADLRVRWDTKVFCQPGDFPARARAAWLLQRAGEHFGAPVWTDTKKKCNSHPLTPVAPKDLEMSSWKAFGQGTGIDTRSSGWCLLQPQLANSLQPSRYAPSGSLMHRGIASIVFAY